MNAVTNETNGKAKTPPIVAAVLSIAVAIIDPSPTQPRKTFTGIDEMAEDIKQKGILQPVLLRPHPSKKGRYELVFGERRFRGTKLAGLTHILAIVRELTDAEVLEIQIVENSKRADIHPLEEADGYRALHETFKMSVEDIAAKVGKSLATVRSRLKLCTLAPEARQAVFDEKLTMGAALVLARIPHADLQAKAVKDVLKRFLPDDGPISARDVSWEVRSKFMLRLVDAPFDRADAGLVAGAPACATCPKRTGNQRELFGDLEGEKDDLCTDVKCFDAKKEAAWERREAEAKEKEQKVLSAKEGKKLFPYGATLAADSGYVDLGAQNFDDPKRRTNKALVGKTDVPVVVVRDPEGKARELVAKDDFRKAVKGSGVRTPERPTTPMSDAAKKARERAAKARETFQAALAELVAKVERREPSEAFWRALARGLVRSGLADTRKDICARRDIEVPKSTRTNAYSEGPLKALLAAAGKMTGAEARGLCVELAATTYRGNAEEAFKELQAVFAPKPAKKKPAAKGKKAKR